jgi:HEAT repeat protein
MPDQEFLGKKLQSADAEERREAVIDLGRSGSGAVLLLFRALGDTDWRVRKTAVEALVHIGGSGVTAQLIKTLSRHDNAGARNGAIEALVHIGTGAVDDLLPMLDDIDADVRKFIIDILGDIRDRRAVPGLIKALQDGDENVRVAAAEALGKIRDRRAVDALLACLQRTDQGWMDYAAAEALGEIGDERALGPLMTALGRVTLREPVLEALGKIGNEKTLEPLVTGLSDPLRIVREVSMAALLAIFRKSGEATRQTIVRAVCEGMSEESVALAEQMLGTTVGELQKACLAVLGWAGRGHSIPKLLALLTEEELEEPMAQALIAMPSDTGSQLIAYLADENALVRRTVARVLGESGRPEAEDPLIDLLGDENGHVRSMAAGALGRLRSRKAVAKLVGLLTDEYKSVQESAIQALAAIGDESVLDRLVKEYTMQNVPLRRNIAQLLGKFSTASAADALVFALKDEEADVRKAVVHALGNLPEGRSLRPLMLAVTDDDPEVRMLAAEALGRLSAPGVSEALISLLEDQDLWVRAAAARGLGRIGGEKAGQLLASYLDKASDIFLLALVEIMGKLRVGQAQAALLRLVDHDDAEVRKVVLTALGGYSWDAVRQAVVSRLSDQHWSVRKAAIEVVRQHRDAALDALLATMAAGDSDKTVRQAAMDALVR